MIEKIKETRILIVATTRLGYEGITSVIMNYYRNIDKTIFQFDFVIGRGIENWVKEEIISSGGSVYELSSRDKKTLNYIKELSKIIKSNKYEIIHVHGNSGTMYLDLHIAKINGVPVRIAHCHNSTCKHKLIHYILKPFLNREITHAFACSDLAGKWIYNKPYTVINNGIQVERFLFNEKIRKKYREELDIKDNFVLGNIGHFSYQKNHEFLLDIFYEVFKLNSKSKLMLIGDGKLREEIINKIKKLGLEESVLILGKRDDADKLIQAMDIFVFPSRFEGLPVALIETQASGLKCIVADTITREAQITGRVEYISLDEKGEYWAEKIVNIKSPYIRDDVYSKFINSKYNIKNETEKLKEIYLKIK